MDPPFTKINMSMFMTYASILSFNMFKNKSFGIRNKCINELGSKINTMNRFLGAVTFNTSLAVALPWEATRIIYPHASNHLIEKTKKKRNISRQLFEFINFVIHIFPVLYMWNVRKHWQHYGKSIHSVYVSMVIHSLWVMYVPQDYNLNRVYMFGDEILNNKQWLSLWMLSFIGHIFRYTTSKFK